MDFSQNGTRFWGWVRDRYAIGTRFFWCKSLIINASTRSTRFSLDFLGVFVKFKKLYIYGGGKEIWKNRVFAYQRFLDIGSFWRFLLPESFWWLGVFGGRGFLAVEGFCCSIGIDLYTGFLSNRFLSIYIDILKIFIIL